MLIEPGVVAISIDGLNPKAITRLGRADTPALHRMMRQGASTLNARTEVELTVTLPNHAGMMTGRPVDSDDGGHGVTVNADRGSTVAALPAGCSRSRRSSTPFVRVAGLSS